MVWSGINKDLFEAVPELEQVALTTFDYFGDEEPGSYLVFEGVFVPHLLEVAEHSPSELQRLMAFVEHAAINEADLVAIGLGEVLPSLSEESLIRAQAGPSTRKVIDKA